MNKAKFVTQVAAFLAFFAYLQVTPAQNQEVLPSEVLKMEREAMGLLRSVPYRSTMTAETFAARGQEPTWKTILIREMVAPDRYREVQEDITQEKSQRRELIAVSSTYYQRFNNGPWQVLPPPPERIVPKNETIPATAAKPKIESNAWLIETLTDKGRMVSIYEYKSTVTREVDGKEVTQMTTTRF